MAWSWHEAFLLRKLLLLVIVEFDLCLRVRIGHGWLTYFTDVNSAFLYEFLELACAESVA